MSGTALKGPSTGRRVCGARRVVRMHTSWTTFQTNFRVSGFGGLGFFFPLTPESINRTRWAASLGFSFQRWAVCLTDVYTLCPEGWPEGIACSFQCEQSWGLQTRVSTPAHDGSSQLRQIQGREDARASGGSECRGQVSLHFHVPA